MDNVREGMSEEGRRSRLLPLVGLVVVLTIMAGMVWLFFLREEDPSAEALAVEEAMVAESEIQARIDAAVAEVEAEFSQEEPTPDILATVQAETALAESRRQAYRSLEPSVLDQGGSLNPFLGEGDREYLESLGPYMWHYTLSWVELQVLVETPVSEWSDDLLGPLMSGIGRRMAGWRTPPQAGGVGVKERVREYGRQVTISMRNLESIMDRLDDASAVYANAARDDASISDFDREAMVLIKRDLGAALDDYSGLMSRYGCSVCGELFRGASLAMVLDAGAGNLDSRGVVATPPAVSATPVGGVSEYTPPAAFFPTVTPSPTPTLTRERTDEPIPPPEPTEQPGSTVEPTEQPSPTPEPTAEPSLTPAPTEEPSPTPVVTEEPCVTPDPADEWCLPPEPGEGGSGS